MAQKLLLKQPSFWLSSRDPAPNMDQYQHDLLVQYASWSAKPGSIPTRNANRLESAVRRLDSEKTEEVLRIHTLTTFAGLHRMIENIPSAECFLTHGEASLNKKSGAEAPANAPSKMLYRFITKGLFVVDAHN